MSYEKMFHTWVRFNLLWLSAWFATHHELDSHGFYWGRNYYSVRSFGYNGKRVSWEICWLKKIDWIFTHKK